jgi:hypothetical protein
MRQSIFASFAIVSVAIFTPVPQRQYAHEMGTELFKASI